MFGRRTAIVLGAGASYCYSEAPAGIPIQANLVGRLFREHDTSSGEGFPSFVGPSGPAHSYRLARYLRERFEIPEDPSKKAAKLDFWTVLQDRGLNLESLYNLLEAELRDDNRALLEDFAAIVRTAVADPVEERGVESVCRYHRRLCESLQPGDYVIDFNWDSVMADAMLYYSHLWFPATGFGDTVVFPVLPSCQKCLPLESFVHLLPIHGSVVLFEVESESENHPGVAFLGPRQLNAASGLMELSGIDVAKLEPGAGASIEAKPTPRDAEEKICSHGYLYHQGTWFKPLFVPPSQEKPHYNHWFMRRLLQSLHCRLPVTEHFVVAGYSFPDADLDYLKEVFVPGVLSHALTVEVVNPSNDDPAFRKRVEDVFGRQAKLTFDQGDFRAYCDDLAIEYPDRSKVAGYLAETVKARNRGEGCTTPSVGFKRILRVLFARTTSRSPLRSPPHPRGAPTPPHPRAARRPSPRANFDPFTA